MDVEFSVDNAAVGVLQKHTLGDRSTIDPALFFIFIPEVHDELRVACTLRDAGGFRV